MRAGLLSGGEPCIAFIAGQDHRHGLRAHRPHGTFGSVVRPSTQPRRRIQVRLANTSPGTVQPHGPDRRCVVVHRDSMPDASHLGAGGPPSGTGAKFNGQDWHSVFLLQWNDVNKTRTLCPKIVISMFRVLLRPPHRKRPHQHRQRHLRRLPPVQDRLHDFRCEQHYAPPTRRLLEPLAVRAYAAGNAPSRTRKHHMDTQTRDQTTRLKARLMARSESTTRARVSRQGEIDINPSRVRGWHGGYHAFGTRSDEYGQSVP